MAEKITPNAPTPESEATVADSIGAIEWAAAATAEDITPAPAVEEKAPLEAAPQDDQEDAKVLEKLNTLRYMASQPRKNAPATMPGRFAYRKAGAILSIDGKNPVRDSAARSLAEAEIHIYQSYHVRRILTGKVIGMRPVFDRTSNSDKIRYCAIVACKDNPFQVYIPVEEFTEADMHALLKNMQVANPTKTMSDAEKLYLTRRIGAEIDFIVTQIPKDGTLRDVMTVGGSRVAAMRDKRIYYWYGRTPDSHYFINIGDKVEARVVAVSAQGIRVEIFGVEAFIHSRELSWSVITDAREKYEVGEKTKVLITDIRREKDNDYFVEYSASVKKAEADPRIAALGTFAPGGVFQGHIGFIRMPTASNPNAKPAVFVVLRDGVQCLCPFPSGSVAPETGAPVTVSIVKTDPEKLYLYGIITHIYKTPGFSY